MKNSEEKQNQNNNVAENEKIAKESPVEPKRKESTDSHRGKKDDWLKWIIIALIVVAVAVLIFGFGVYIGGMKAQFSFRWAEEYHNNFAGPQDGFFGDWQQGLPGGDFIESHGSFGEIIFLNETGFVIKGRGDTEIVVEITDDTIIKKGGETVEDQLAVGDIAVIIGSPDDLGRIEAKLIRIFDEYERVDRNPDNASRIPVRPF